MGIFPGYNVTQLVVNQGAAGSTDLVAAPTGTNERIFVVTICLGMTVAGTLGFLEGTGATVICGAIPLAANAGFVMQGSNEYPVLYTPTAQSKLTLITTGGAAKGWIVYFLDRSNP